VTPIAVSAMVWVFILIPLLVVWAVAFIDIFRRDLPAGRKAGWILVVVLLPVIGTITYFLMRKPSQAEIERASHFRR
jgi:uncharacterized membrane protein YhaH (DUF805 family)